MTRSTDTSPWAVPPIAPAPAPAPPAAQRQTPPPARPSAPAARSGHLPRVAFGYAGGAAFTWLGVHGGAGVSALARATQGGVALSGQWPDPQLGWPSSVAVVCRTDARGLAAAGRALAQWAARQAPDLDVLALVAVADSPERLSRTLRLRLHELAGAVPLVVTVPWIASWREDPGAPDPAATNAATRVVARTH